MHIFKKMKFEAYSRIIPQIIRANLVQLRASSDGNYFREISGFSPG